MMNVWGMTDIGLVRKENQDAYAVRLHKDAGQLVAVVCDGMGGAKGGALASKLASSTFIASCIGNLQSGFDVEDVQRVSEFAVSAANSAVYEKSVADEKLHGMGTTLVSVIAWDKQVLISNVGDSRAYVIRAVADEETGRHIFRVTKDHSLVERLVDMGNITEEEARCHPDRNLVTRVLGPVDNILSDSYHLTLETGDFILLCSDGLVDTVTDLEMEREVLRSGEENSCLSRLLEISKKRGAADNVTAVLLRQQ